MAYQGCVITCNTLFADDTIEREFEPTRAGWTMASNMMRHAFDNAARRLRLMVHIYDSEAVPAHRVTRDTRAFLVQHPGIVELTVTCDGSEPWGPDQMDALYGLLPGLAQGTAVTTLRFYDEVVGHPSEVVYTGLPDRGTDVGVAKLNLHTPTRILCSLADAIVQRNPTVLRSLKLSPTDREPDIVFDAYLPRGVTGLESLTIPAGMADSLHRLTHPLNELSLWTMDQMHLRPPQVPAACLGRGTTWKGSHFVQAVDSPRTKCIRYTGQHNIDRSLNWRTQLLDIRERSIDSVCCDAIAIRTSGWNEHPILTGANHLLVVRVDINGPADADIALQAAREAFPQAKALQAQARGDWVVTVFPDGLPSRNEDLVDLCVALCIVKSKGDGDEAVDNIHAAARELDDNGLQHMHALHIRMLKQLVVQAAGKIISKAEAGVV